MSELPKPVFLADINPEVSPRSPKLPKSAMPSPEKPISDFLHKYTDAVKDAIKRADGAFAIDHQR